MADGDVTLLSDRDNAPRLVETAEGRRGQRTYLVQLHDEARALEAPGVPRIGDPWSDDQPNLVAVSREARYQGGRETASAGAGAMMHIVVGYETPGRFGAAPVVPRLGLGYTELEGDPQTASRLFGIDPPQFAPDTLPAGAAWAPGRVAIDNGRGADVEVWRLTAFVTRFMEPSVFSVARLRELIAMAGTVNEQEYLLPPLFARGGPMLALLPGQGLYRRPTLSMNGELLAVRHEIALAPNHHVYWQAEDQQGRADGGVLVSQVYPARAWANL